MSNKRPRQTYNQYKIRAFSLIKGIHENYGITIPKEMAKSNQGIKFNVEIISSNVPVTLYAGTYIIFKSGLDLAQLKKDINKYDISEHN